MRSSEWAALRRAVVCASVVMPTAAAAQVPIVVATTPAEDTAERNYEARVREAQANRQEHERE